ncbi:MAG TPA: urea ABC transporter permease subunit UrtC, partial [Verrucomicrobiaceae bacterium]
VWCAVGGRGTLVCPIIGAIGVNALKSWATRAFPDLWLILLGGVFILIVLLMPKGIVGLPAQIRAAVQRHRRKTDAAGENSAAPAALPAKSASSE